MVALTLCALVPLVMYKEAIDFMSPEFNDTVAEVLHLGPDAVKAELTPDDVEKWDSLNHLRLITAIENRFQIRLSMSQIQSIQCLGDLHGYVEEAAS